jgi:hypothetical protein
LQDCVKNLKRNSSKLGDPDKSHIISISSSLSYETEYIARGYNGFILGYVDAVIDIKYDIILESLRGKQSFNYNYSNIIVLEAKPVLDSIGQVIRQMKTYRDAINDSMHTKVGCCMRIATYTKLGEDEIEFMRHEGIEVIQFDR